MKIIQKIKGPDGINPDVGECRLGQTFEVSDEQAAYMVEGGEFEIVEEATEARSHEATEAEAQRQINLD